MNTRTQKITVFDNVLPQVVTSSTDATPVVVTKAAHGYSTGDLIMIQGHTTNVAVNGIFKIVVLSSSTFALYNPLTGAAIAGSGAGAGSGGVMAKLTCASVALFSNEFRTQTAQIITTGTATMTIKFAISNGKPDSASNNAAQDVPIFGATVGVNNPWTLAKIIDLDTNDEFDGNVGVVATGADIQKDFEINTNYEKYLFPLLTSWTAGRLSLILNMTNQQ